MNFFKQYHPGHITKEMKTKTLEKEHIKSKKLLKELVDGIDNWNESMEKIIGRHLDYKWPALEEAKEFLKNNK